MRKRGLAPLLAITGTMTLVFSSSSGLNSPTQAFVRINPDNLHNYAGSQQLEQQIEQGAQADVFASANQDQMDTELARQNPGEND